MCLLRCYYGKNAVEVMQTEGIFQSGESVCFEAEAMPLYAMLCIVMELLPGWIVAGGIQLTALWKCISR